MYSSSTKTCVTQLSIPLQTAAAATFLSSPSLRPVYRSMSHFPPFRPRQKKGGRAQLPSAEARHRLRRGLLLLLLLLLLPYRPPLSCANSMTLLLLLPKAKHRQRREGPAFSKFLGLAFRQKVFRAPLLLTPLCPCMPVLYVRTAGLLAPPLLPHFLTAKAILSFGAFLFFPYRL